MKTTYQSKYRAVAVERDAYWGVVRLYVSENHERIASWYRGVNPAIVWPIARADEMLEKAAIIAPVFHGSHGPVAQISQPTA